jgi:hypothetical protein
MKIKMTATTRIQGPGKLAEGSVVEVDDETGQHLIDQGLAEATTAAVTKDEAPDGSGSATVPDRPADFHVELRGAAAEPAPEPEPEPEPEPAPELAPEPTTTGASARRTLSRTA